VDEKIRVFFKDPMWCLACPTHGEQSFTSRAEAEQEAAKHASDDGLDWEVEADPF
jgi:hypothetical protein